MKEKQPNIQETIYRLLKRSANSQGHYYAYEIHVVSENEMIPVIPRTTNIEEFYENMESASILAKEKGNKIRVEIFRGKSPKAQQISSYEIVLNENQRKETSGEASDKLIERAIEKALAKKAPQKEASLFGELEGLNKLLGVLSNNNETNSKENGGLGGLFGLIGVVNNSQHENNMIQFEKKFNEYKLSNQIEILEKDLSKVAQELEQVKVRNVALEKENVTYKGEVVDLEHRLAGYSNTELLKRVAVGAISSLGGRILGNSPKVAELMGLSKNDLQMALGTIEDNDTMSEFEKETKYDVEINEITKPDTSPQETQMQQAINETMEALKMSDPKFAYAMISIIGHCMDSEELTKRMILHLREEVAKQEEPDANENQNNENEA
ncbi:MAG: hypothetical protein JEZ09_14440 [Salinivirgaceae bacterium]|nr:hypothetical protein [Salinivirgaceae bacterium]